jgi:hypothetical protein
VVIDVLEEPWNEYILSDGTKLRQKLVLIHVARIAGAYGQLGRPIYQPAFNLAFSVVAPKELRGQPSIPPPDMREVARRRPRSSRYPGSSAMSPAGIDSRTEPRPPSK